MQIVLETHSSLWRSFSGGRTAKYNIWTWLAGKCRLVTIGIRCLFRSSSFMVKERSPKYNSCFLAFIALHASYTFTLTKSIEIICWLLNNDWGGVWAEGLHILMTYLQICALGLCRCRLLKPTLLATRRKMIDMDLPSRAILNVWLKDFACKSIRRKTLVFSVSNLERPNLRGAS